MDNNSSGVETSRDKNFVPCLRFMTAATFNTNILILLVHWAGFAKVKTENGLYNMKEGGV